MITHETPVQRNRRIGVKFIVIDQMGLVRSDVMDEESCKRWAKRLDRIFRTGAGGHEAYPLKCYKHVNRQKKVVVRM